MLVLTACATSQLGLVRAPVTSWWYLDPRAIIIPSSHSGKLMISSGSSTRPCIPTYPSSSRKRNGGWWGQLPVSRERVQAHGWRGELKTQNDRNPPLVPSLSCFRLSQALVAMQRIIINPKIVSLLSMLTVVGEESVLLTDGVHRRLECPGGRCNPLSYFRPHFEGFSVASTTSTQQSAVIGYIENALTRRPLIRASLVSIPA